MNRKKAMTVMFIIIGVILICSFFLVRWIRNQNEDTDAQIISNETIDDTSEDTTTTTESKDTTTEEKSEDISEEESTDTTTEETTEATVTVAPQPETTPAQTKAPEATKKFAESVTDKHGNVWIWDAHSYLPGGGGTQPHTTIISDYVTSDDVDESVVGWH